MNEGDCTIDVADDDSDNAGLWHLSKAVHTSYINLKRTNPLIFD
jgi:hypothetical protein